MFSPQEIQQIETVGQNLQSTANGLSNEGSHVAAGVIAMGLQLSRFLYGRIVDLSNALDEANKQIAAFHAADPPPCPPAEPSTETVPAPVATQG